MSISRPLILMALANDSNNSLELEAEEKEVRKELASAHDSERIEFRSLGNTTLEDIYAEINRANRKIAILHYSGHSNGAGLALEDTMVKRESMTTLLSSLPHLKLVFLNGCANFDQVEILHNNGVPAVIATSVPIGDRTAKEFAKLFYQSISGGRSIQDSFNTAASFIKNNDNNNVVFRDLFFDDISDLTKEKKEEEFPWGLYYKKESDVAWHIPLQEQLDETSGNQVTTFGSEEFQLDATEPNKTITFGDSKTPVDAIELVSNDRRVQNFNGTARITGSVLLGRGPTCQIVILEKGVSRKHAKISREGDQFILYDENSTNGTFWNDQRISQMPIIHDGTLRLETVEFTVKVVK